MASGNTKQQGQEQVLKLTEVGEECGDVCILGKSRLTASLSNHVAVIVNALRAARYQ